MISAILMSISGAFSLAFRPLEHVRPDIALLAVSSATGIVMLAIYLGISDQKKLAPVMDGVKAHILEIRLYKNELPVMLKALRKAFVKNLYYLRLLLLPAAFLMLIVGILLVYMYPYFEYSPVRPGESFLLKVSLRDLDGSTHRQVSIEAPRGITVETPPLVMAGEVDWRLTAEGPGEFKVIIHAGGEQFARGVHAGNSLTGVSRTAGPLSLKGYIANPLNRPLADGPLRDVTVVYPERAMKHLPLMLGMDWLAYFFIVSFAAALAAKVCFKIKITYK